MKRFINITWILLYAMLSFAPLAKSAEDTRLLETKVVDLLAKLPADNLTALDKINAEFIQLGSKGILQICDLLVPPGTSDDANVRYALSGLAKYAGRQNAEKERKMLSNVFLKSLSQASDNEVKAFLIRQLQLVGKKEAVKPLVAYLTDERLCEPATQALLAIRTKGIDKAFLKALPSVKGSNQVTIIKALGELQYKKATKQLLEYATSEDTDTRRVALFALANIGSKESGSVLATSMQSAADFEKAHFSSLYLLYAQRRAESGKKEECISICRDLLNNQPEKGEKNVQCAALSLLTDVTGVEALNDLLAAMDSENQELQGTALQLAERIPGKGATSQWVAKMNKVPSQTRASIIAMLGRRGDKSALPELLQATTDRNKTVKLTAISAAAQLGYNEALQTLLDIMKTGWQDEVDIVKESILSYTDSKVLPTLANNLSDMPDVSRIALLEILAARQAKAHLNVVINQARGTNGPVSLAAMSALENMVSAKDLPVLIDLLTNAKSEQEIQAAQDAIVASANQIENPEKRADLLLQALPNTAEDMKEYLLLPMARIGGEKALQTVVEASKSSDPELKSTAVWTIANWCDISAADELLKLAQNEEYTSYQSMVANGYIQLVRKAELQPAQKFSMLKEAMFIAKTKEQKQRVLEVLATVRTVESLLFVAPYLEDESLQEDAAKAAVDIACPQYGSDKGLVSAKVSSVLQKVVKVIKDPYLKKQAEQHIDTIASTPGISGGLNQPPAGFVALFNGIDLTGWKGLAGEGGNPISRANMTPAELAQAQVEADSVMRANWKVKDGELIFSGHGKSLCTSRDYGDFEMYVDWKIEKGGDSGIYLRGAPQVQIWDTAQWPEGSGGLYNNKKNPSKPLVCADNPIGEWNTFRIKMVGERVTVYLNDKLVVDDVVMENYWDRNQPIFPTGQIELQSHGSTLYFRNVFIREIPRKGEWRSLFNGVNLEGWTGATDGYYVEDGKIICPKDKDRGGNLFTVDEFSDFILRFEFKLTPGANNGLGIRAPLEGDAAYVGMELQILDNTAHIYKDLKPWQYHGSVYGIAAAKRGFLKPVGEWNYEEVIANGRQITVKLNGTTIVDADIDKASTPQPLDGKKHPGVKREKGHIGFLGHGAHVEFRNLQIKEID